MYNNYHTIVRSVPTSPPANIATTVLSSTEIMVTWDPVPPIDQNGIITMYEVLYQPLETFGGAIGPLTRNVSGTEMSVVLVDLEEFIRYVISIRAYTSLGNGPYSVAVTSMTLEDGNCTFIHADCIMVQHNTVLIQLLPVLLITLMQVWRHLLR